MFNPHAYGVCVRLVQHDGEKAQYSGTVRELPDVEVFEDSYAEAYESAIAIIGDLHTAAAEGGEPFPSPETVVDLPSGRVTLRLSRSMHLSAARAAQADNISLNSWICEAIAWRLAEAMGTRWASSHGVTQAAYVGGVSHVSHLYWNASAPATRFQGSNLIVIPSATWSGA